MFQTRIKALNKMVFSGLSAHAYLLGLAAKNGSSKI